VTAPAQDAIEYARTMNQTIQRSLVIHGHSACRLNDQGRYDYATTEVVCGCGHRVKLEGAQPGPPPVVVESTAGEVATPRDPIQAALSSINPTMAYTPVDLEMRILDVLARLEQGMVFERELSERAANVSLAWERAYWIAYNSSEAGAADRRKADAMVTTMDLHQEMLTAQFAEKAAKSTMHTLRAVLSGYQSVAKSVIADFNAGGANR
jgi:hypothetical protein